MLLHPLLFPFQQTTRRGFNPFRRFSYSSYPNVADATSRLSLLGIASGYRVHQVDNNTVYQYNGPSTDDVAGMNVGGPGIAGAFVVTSTNDGKNYYNKAGTPDSLTESVIVWAADPHGSGGTWIIYDEGGAPADSNADDVATPDLATWLTATVEIDHIASESNWSIVP